VILAWVIWCFVVSSFFPFLISGFKTEIIAAEQRDIWVSFLSSAKEKGILIFLIGTNSPLIDLIIQLHKKKVPSFLTANSLRDSLQTLLYKIVNATWIAKAEGRRKDGLLDKADK